MPYGSLYVGKKGFLYKKSGAVGNSRVLSLGLITNQTTDLYNRYVPGSGVGATNYSTRRNKIRNAAKCKINNCSINYYYMGIPLPYTPYVPGPCTYLPSNTKYQFCSPWPQFGGPYNTNSRSSPFLSSQDGNQKWKSQIGNENYSIAFSSTTIANDGTIYVGTYDGTNGYMYAFTSSGNTKWIYNIPNQDYIDQSSQTIDIYGTIYFGTYGGYLYAINSNGTLKWSIQFSTLSSINTSPIIDSNGYILFGTGEGYLFCINANGYVIWSVLLQPVGTSSPSILDSPAIGSDGTIYVCSLTSSNNCGYLYALNGNNGSTKWIYGVPNEIQNRPIISVDGTSIFIGYNIFISPSNYYSNIEAINVSNGLSKWTKQIDSNSLPQDSFATNSSDGTIYILTNNDNEYRTYLYALNPNNGFEKWNYKVEKINGSFSDCSPIVGSDGTIYFNVSYYDSDDIINGESYAINSDGIVKWNKSFGQDTLCVLTSPSIGLDGTLYMNTYEYTNTGITTVLRAFN